MMQNLYRRDRDQGFDSFLPRVFTHVPVLGEGRVSGFAAPRLSVTTSVLDVSCRIQGRDWLGRMGFRSIERVAMLRSGSGGSTRRCSDARYCSEGMAGGSKME